MSATADERHKTSSHCRLLRRSTTAQRRHHRRRRRSRSRWRGAERKKRRRLSYKTRSGILQRVLLRFWALLALSRNSTKSQLWFRKRNKKFLEINFESNVSKLKIERAAAKFNDEVWKDKPVLEKNTPKFFLQKVRRWRPNYLFTHILQNLYFNLLSTFPDHLTLTLGSNEPMH